MPQTDTDIVALILSVTNLVLLEVSASPVVKKLPGDMTTSTATSWAAAPWWLELRGWCNGVPADNEAPLLSSNIGVGVLLVPLSRANSWAPASSLWEAMIDGPSENGHY